MLKLRLRASVCSALIAIAVVAVALQSPFMVTWYRQPDQGRAMSGGAPGAEVAQQIVVEKNVIDAVGLVLPTDMNRATGRLAVTLVGPEGGELSRSGVDVSGVQDWGLRIFRMPTKAEWSPGMHVLRLSSEKPQYFAASSTDAYPQGTMLVGEADSGTDLAIRLYESIGPIEYVKHASAASETSTPPWLPTLAAMFALALLIAFLWSPAAEPAAGTESAAV